MKNKRNIKKKNNETIYETYARVLCPDCSNKYNTEDLCDIRVRQDNTAKCMNFKRCMENKCNTCKYNLECFEDEVKQNT